MPLRFMVGILITVVLTGCQASSPGDAFSVKPAWDHQVQGLTHYSLANGYDIWVQPSPIVTMSDIEKAWIVKDNLGRPAAMIEFDAAGTARISRFTSGHVRQPVAVFVNDLLVSAPRVQSELGSTFMVMGIGDEAAVEQFIANCQAQIDASD